jgi:hypothetical protein
MSELQNNQQPPLPEEEGINFKKLFGDVRQYVNSHYRRLRLWLAAAAVVIAAFFLLGMFLAPPMSSYSEAVAFNFPQSEKGKYPNGSPFSITDLANRNVLDQVWRDNKLGSVGITFKDFVESVSVTPYADNEAFIKAKYESMLARKQLNSVDITSIERDYRSEMESQSKKMALVTLTTAFSSPISGPLARKVLADIPKVWADQAINRLGVVSIPMTDSQAVQEDVLKKGSPFQVLDYFYKSTEQLGITLNRIASFPGGETLIDPQTGLTVNDLKRRINDLNRYWVLDFDNYVQQGQRVSDIDVRSAEIHLKELKDQQQQRIAEAQTYKAALQDYDALARQNKSINARELGADYRNQGALQLQGDSVQRLIDLGSQNKDAEFRQELTKKRVDAELQAKSMDQEILRNERRIAVAKSGGTKGAADPAKMKYYKDEIWSQLQAISGSIQRMQATEQARFKDDNGQLYNVGSIVKGNASGVAARFFLPMGLLILLGLLGLGVYLIKRLGHEQH